MKYGDQLMSKWTEQFEAHAFQKVWSELKIGIKSATVDDETVFTSVIELARLKKVIEYLDGMVQSVDPELVPFTTWDAFYQQAVPCLQQIINYNSNRNIANLVQANVHADNLLTYLRPYMVLPKEAAASVKRAATIYLKTVEEYVNSFQEKSGELVNEIAEHKLNSETLFTEIEDTKSSVDEYESLLFGEHGDAGIQTEISNLYIDIDNKHEKINEVYNEILVGDEDELSTKQTISLARDEIIEEQKNISLLMESIKKEVNELNKFHIKIFGTIKKDDTGIDGLSDEFDRLIQNMTDFKVKQELRYKALNDEIETLLPGATSAGLATAYRSLRKSFSKPLKVYSQLFYVSLIILFIASLFFVIEEVTWTNINFVDISSLENLGNNILYKLPLFLPVIWLAIFASKRRSEAQRLQQEYAHKEAMAKSYQNFKQQIENLGDEDKSMQKALIMKAIDAIAHNASGTLDGKHGDKMPAQEMFESAVNAAAKLSTLNPTKS